MASLVEIEAALGRMYLTVSGGLEPAVDDPALPAGTQVLLLVSPAGDGFWPYVAATPEFADGDADPLDRWSRRVLEALAVELSATALFPSDGPPYKPFVSWALASGSFHSAPIGLLVHAEDGLMCSLRGALCLPFRVDLPRPAPAPCETCADRPCLDACPVGAFASGRFAVANCHNHLDTSAGSDCMERGCAARRACPASRRSGRTEAQSAFHMRAFHGTR